jgi:cytidylate kinase
MAVISISREIGSAGDYIAQKVAQELGYHFGDKDIIETVLNQYGFVQFEKEYESGPGFWARFDAQRTKMVDFSNQVIQAMARHGNIVILGRGSFAVLSGFADVLNIRLQAPLSLRVSRVMEQQSIAEPDQAEALVKESDKVRANFVESWYGIRWDIATAFNLVIDTGTVPPDVAAAWLVEAVQNLPKKSAGSPLTTAQIQIDYVLDKVVSETLACQETH